MGKDEQVLQPVEIDSLNSEVFRIFEKRQPLLTGGTAEGFNTMTIGWGGLGTLWSLPVCTVYVRPQRYTYEFMNKNDCFTVSVLPETYHQAIAYCGTKSGRDVDKVAQCALTPVTAACGAVYFQQAELVLVCRCLYRDDLREACFCDNTIPGRCYPTKDYHRFYIGQVLQVLRR